MCQHGPSAMTPSGAAGYARVSASRPNRVNARWSGPDSLERLGAAADESRRGRLPNAYGRLPPVRRSLSPRRRSASVGVCSDCSSCSRCVLCCRPAPSPTASGDALGSSRPTPSTAFSLRRAVRGWDTRRPSAACRSGPDGPGPCTGPVADPLRRSRSAPAPADPAPPAAPIRPTLRRRRACPASDPEPTPADPAPPANPAPPPADPGPAPPIPLRPRTGPGRSCPAPSEPGTESIPRRETRAHDPAPRAGRAPAPKQPAAADPSVDQPTPPPVWRRCRCRSVTPDAGNGPARSAADASARNQDGRWSARRSRDSASARSRRAACRRDAVPLRRRSGAGVHADRHRRRCPLAPGGARSRATRRAPAWRERRAAAPRGPPAPLDSRRPPRSRRRALRSSAGGASGGAIARSRPTRSSFTFADGGTAVATDSCDHAPRRRRTPPRAHLRHLTHPDEPLRRSGLR